MDAVFRRAAVAGLVIDDTGRVIEVNDAAARLLDQPVSALIGRDLLVMVKAEDRSTIERALGSAVDGAIPTAHRCNVHLGDDVPSAAVVDIAGLPEGMFVVQLSDAFTTSAATGSVEEQRAFRSALLELSELSYEEIDDIDFYDALIERAISVVPGAQAGSILICTPGTDEFHFVAARGFDLAALEQRCLHRSDLFRDLDTPTATINRDVAQMELSPEHEEWLADAARIREIVSNVAAPVLIDGDAVAFISLDNFADREAFGATSEEMTTVLGRLIADLLRRRDLESQLRRERAIYEHQAMHDELTGLANRRQIEATLDAAVSTAGRAEESLGLLFIDIDDFKSINDRFGHDIGDEVLTLVAGALKQATCRSDLVGRWGGDEFIVIASGARSRRDVEALAQRILGAVQVGSSRSCDDITECHLSIGAVWTADSNEGRATLMQRADSALYSAKQSGKNTYRMWET